LPKKKTVPTIIAKETHHFPNKISKTTQQDKQSKNQPKQQTNTTINLSKMLQLKGKMHWP
jgi:hypothetical protein